MYPNPHAKAIPQIARYPDLSTPTPRPLLTAKELAKHPEYPHVVWDLKPTSKGSVPVAKGRGGPINISYEIHGHGPRLLVVSPPTFPRDAAKHAPLLTAASAQLIMGLGGLKSSWQRQTKDFGHEQADKYSMLIFDNRGIGDSDKPFMRYSTSEMALDTLELLDHVGWTAERSLNIWGISMGGMIAQELVCPR